MSMSKTRYLKIIGTLSIGLVVAQGALGRDKSLPLKSIKPVTIEVQKEVSPETSREATQSKPSEIQATKTRSKTWDSFVELRRKYRAGEITDQQAWEAIVKFEGELKSLTKTQQAAMLQTQATLLNKANQPVLASLYAAQALRGADDPTDDDYRRSWQILRDVSRDHPLQNLLEIVATSVDIGDKKAPGFGTDWNYFVGNALIKSNKPEKALPFYQKVAPGDRYYFPAKFQEAMIYLDADKKLDAIAALKSIAYPASAPGKKIKTEEYESIKDHANMALGRIYYEERKFRDSIKHYRLVRRSSPQFYDSLFEQSWALFLAGYPNHALGMIHGVRSPFFKDAFNPESTMLASMIYYWMCRYDDSRAELADFMTQHQKSIDALDRYLKKGIKDPKTYYQLFEDTVTGVSSESLGIPREVLVMATQQDNLLYVRDQYATVIKELQKLESKGIFGNKNSTEGAQALLEKWAGVLKEDIGIRLHNELKAMRLDYERLYDQGQFLYVELLMSKKDQLLGKELHSSTKISKVTQVDNIKGWGKKTQSWAGDDKNEYWADELGFHIYRLKPMCVTQN